MWKIFLKLKGLDLKKIKQLYKELNIRNIDQLKEAIEQNKLEKIKGFGKKTQENILQGIEFVNENIERFLISEIEEDVEEIVSYLKKIEEGLIKENQTLDGDIQTTNYEDISKP